MHWTNSAGVYVAGVPVAGNIYQMSNNGVAAGNGTANARIRNTTGAGVQKFPGDQLILNTNTEIRIKGTGTFGTTVNFPGVSGNPGLVLNGGLINSGDNIGEYLDGVIQIPAGAQSYYAPGNNLGGTISLGRALDIKGQLIGSGTLVMFQAGAPTPPTVPTIANSGLLRVSGNNNPFSGNWILKNGWLNASGVNSLGTNSTVVVDPSFVLPVPPLGAITPVTQPAILEISQDFNGGGSLTLTNGGAFYLHTHCCFTNVTVEGTSLTSGTYRYADLAAAFPNNFPQIGDGTLNSFGTITVQPYGAPPQFPPVISSQPTSVYIFTNRTARFKAAAAGAFQQPATFQWYKNNSPLTDGLNVSGSTALNLTLSNVVAADAGYYTLVVAAGGLSSTSGVATLNISVPNDYENAVITKNPIVLYTLNETDDPSTGTAPASDVLGNYSGTYVGSVQNGYYGVAGPQTTADTLIGFPDSNLAFANSAAGGEVSIPGWNLNTNTVTFTLWLKPTANPAGAAGLVMCRGSQVGGICFGNNNTNGLRQLGINWNNEAASYNWNSGLTVPLNLWSLAALAISPTNATLYVVNTNGLSVASIARSNTVVNFGGTIQIGNDTAGGANRGLDGSIDDVAVFGAAFSQQQIMDLWAAASGIHYFPVTIAAQPMPQTFFSTGGVAHFSVAATGTTPITYRWYRGATALTDGLNVSGSTNTALTISNFSASDLGAYHVAVSNIVGTVLSSNASLSVQAPSGNSYQAAVLADSPIAFYELNETTDPAAGDAVAFDYVGGFNGIYGTAVLNGNASYNIQGPQPSTGFPGFTADNTAAQFAKAANAQISLAPFNVNTNTPVAMSMAAWIYPAGLEPSNAGLLFSRATGSVAGLDYSSAADPSGSGDHTLGYIWNNNDANTYNWSSWLVPPQNQWSLVVLTVSPTNAIIYMVNTNSYYTCAHVYNHVPQQFSGTTLIGDDSYDAGNGNRAFIGIIDNVAVFNNVLSPSQVLGLFGAASGISNFPPTLAVAPQSTNAYQMQTVQLKVNAGGSDPLYYQWMAGAMGMGVFTNLADNGHIVGSTSPTLTISNIDMPDAADYIVVITNSFGAVSNAPAATLAVQPTNPPTLITMAVQQGYGLDWDTGTSWSDGNPASLSALAYPGSTYEVLTNARLRTPLTAPATFPGVILFIDGDGVYAQNGTPTIGEIRFKSTPITFPRLVMNGGMVDTSTPGGLTSTPVTIEGIMEVRSNTPCYNDSSDDEGLLINAFLTGAGNLEYHNLGYSLANGNTMNVACPTNNYTGTWNIVQGTLLGSGANALGTNTLTIGAAGALETTYDINNQHGDLILNGQMLLHQNDTFRMVKIGGSSLAPGTYSYAQLAAAHPGNFPASWAPQKGSAVTSASGSITVLAAPAPVTITYDMIGSAPRLTWSQGKLLQATNLAGPWSLVTGAASPYTVTVSPATPEVFFRVQQ